MTFGTQMDVKLYVNMRSHLVTKKPCQPGKFGSENGRGFPPSSEARHGIRSYLATSPAAELLGGIRNSMAMRANHPGHWAGQTHPRTNHAGQKSRRDVEWCKWTFRRISPTLLHFEFLALLPEGRIVQSQVLGVRAHS